ncbi:penicillin-binding protein activator [Psychrobium sp. nBUS_13]|uniref:penicillin-binding protein activator n=1 Tax=Psychrobium sp. nBUS_13 TaxID=3395319 RepID=UPI003EC14DC3
MFKLSFGKDCKQLICIAAISLILWGCGSTPSTKNPKATNAISLGQATQTHDYYADKAIKSSGIQQQAYYLLALRSALNNGQLDAADNYLGLLPSNSMLNDDHRLELQLLQSLRFAYADDLSLAIATLSPSSSWQVSENRLVTLYQQRANFLTQNQQPALAANDLIDALSLAQEESLKATLRQTIWQEYQLLPIEELESLLTTATSIEQSGWLALAIIGKNALQSPESLQQQLMQWGTQYPTHALSNHIPERLVAAANVIPYTPKKISVILPLSGRYERIGQAVQNGILSNLMAQNSEQEIQLIDSHDVGAVAAYQQAIDTESEFIIGPLLKSNVEQVVAIESTIPTLFLNTPRDASAAPNQFFFSLDKESEALQGAKYIYQLGKTHPVVVAPDNVRGHQISALFSQQWQELHEGDFGAEDVEVIFFKKDSELKATIERLFETDKSQKRINTIRYLVGNKMEAETHSRRDIDAVYLVANPKQTSMLMPSVEVTVSAYANQVPVFVGSSGNAYRMTDSGLTHLNQLTISEIPWLLSTDNELSPSKIKRLWPKMKQSQLRLFAMGHDAYGLIERLAQMRLFPEYRLQGLSGQLNLDEQSKIHREMSWAQFQRGRLKKIQ